MSLPLAKRRRLDSVASTLHKPFKSPLRSGANDAAPNNEANHPTPSKLKNEVKNETTQRDATLVDGAPDVAISSTTKPSFAQNKPIHGTFFAHTGGASHSNRPSVMPIFFSSTVAAHSRPLVVGSGSAIFRKPATPYKPGNTQASPNSASTEAQTLIRANRALEAAIRAQREDLDTLRQATKLVSSRRDEELVELVGKWRGVTREAAEEVFATVRERVNRMGGVGAWREREAKKREWMREWDAKGAENDGAPDQDGDDEEDEASGSDEESDAAAKGMDEVDKARMKEMRREYKREQREQRETVQKGAMEYAEPNPDEEKVPDPIPSNGQDDDTFTMDMMLQILNIESDVIGYDKDEQRWVD